MPFPSTEQDDPFFEEYWLLRVPSTTLYTPGRFGIGPYAFVLSFRRDFDSNLLHVFYTFFLLE